MRLKRLHACVCGAFEGSLKRGGKKEEGRDFIFIIFVTTLILCELLAYKVGMRIYIYIYIY